MSQRGKKKEDNVSGVKNAMREEGMRRGKP